MIAFERSQLRTFAIVDKSKSFTILTNVIHGGADRNRELLTQSYHR